MIRQSASLNCQTIWDYRPTVVTATLAVFQLNNILWARKCQPQSRHHPRRRRRVCHVRLGTRPWYASRSPTRRQAGEESQRAGGEHEGGATARRAKLNDRHTHLADPLEGRAGATARDDTARRHRRHERACSNQQHSRATTTRSRPNTAQSGPRTIWGALSRGGASEGRIGAVVVFVWVASAVERDISTASIRQGRDSIQRAVKRPETI